MTWWKNTYPKDFHNLKNISTNYPYPEAKANKCDIIFSSDDQELDNAEWAIELKKIAFLGDNGKNNDYNVQKMLSPYLKDRSLIHDIHKLRKNPVARKQAVIGYCFNYDFSTCDEALELHPEQKTRIKQMRAVCKKNNDKTGELNIKEVVDFANQIFTTNNLARNLVQNDFTGAWRHPCGGGGTIFGWEV
jgi:hypothetical protein